MAGIPYKAGLGIDPDEEKLRKRMELARQQGWGEEEIQRSALVERTLSRSRKQQEQQALMERTKTKQKGGRGGTATSFISEAGGLGGAAGGAAIGTAIFPGVGTLIGAGLGGLFGGFGGSAVEQKVRDDKVDYRKALKEGIIEGALSAGPLKVAKAVKVGGKALLKGAGKEALQEASEAVIQKSAGRGVLSRTGETLRGEARGIDVGAKVGGRRIGNERVKQLNDFMETTIKPKGGSAAAQQEAVEQFIQGHNNSLTNAIQKSNRALTATDKKKLISTVRSEFKNNIVGATKRQSDIADDLIERIKQAPDVKSLDQLRKIVDDGINFARNPSSAEPGAEQVFKLFRRNLTDDVASKVTGAKYIKTNLHNAFDIDELILNKAAKPGSGMSFAGATLPGRAAQSLETVAGKGLGKLGSVQDQFRGFGTKSLAGRVAAGSAISSIGTPRQEIQQELPTDISQIFEPPQTEEEALIQQLVQGGAMDFETVARGLNDYRTQQATQPEMAGQEQGITSRDYIVAANQKVQEGDLKTADKLFEFAQIMNEFEANAAESMGGGKQKLSQDQQKRLINMSNVDSELQSLEQEVLSSGIFPESSQLSASLGGIFQKTIGQVTDTEKKIYLDQLKSRGIAIIRAMGEVGNLSETEQKAAQANLPTAGDTMQGALEKIKRLRNRFAAIRQNVTAAPVTQDFSDLSNLFAEQGAFQ